MMKFNRTTLAVAMILVSAPELGWAGTLLNDDSGVDFGNPTAITEEDHGAIHLRDGIDQSHDRFNVTDEASPKLTGSPVTGSMPAPDLVPSTFSDEAINSNVASMQNRFESHNVSSSRKLLPVPEPTSLSLIALAGIGYVARFLRRHRIGILRS